MEKEDISAQRKLSIHSAIEITHFIIRKPEKGYWIVIDLIYESDQSFYLDINQSHHLMCLDRKSDVRVLPSPLSYQEGYVLLLSDQGELVYTSAEMGPKDPNKIHVLSDINSCKSTYDADWGQKLIEELSQDESLEWQLIEELTETLDHYQRLGGLLSADEDQRATLFEKELSKLVAKHKLPPIEYGNYIHFRDVAAALKSKFNH